MGFENLAFDSLEAVASHQSFASSEEETWIAGSASVGTASCEETASIEIAA